MISNGQLPPPAPHRFVRGSRWDAPVLVPLVPPCADCHAMIRFCRRICPGAPVFVPDIALIRADDGKAGREPDIGTIDRLAAVIGTILRIPGLSLIPVVAIGDGAGTDLVVGLAAGNPMLPTACILLRPTQRTATLPPASLDGVSVLLARIVSEEVIGSAGWQLRNALARAGAQVVSERVSPRPTAGQRDATIARVFIATLFGGCP